MLENMRREIFYSSEYLEFQKDLGKRARIKLLYITTVLETADSITSKFVKKLVNTDFYELRISVENEIRIILFSVDSIDINSATKILFLNGFTKKRTGDYSREIDKAIRIIRKLYEKEGK